MQLDGSGKVFLNGRDVSLPSDRPHQAEPEENHTGNSTAIVSVSQRGIECLLRDLLGILTIGGNPGITGSHDNCEGDGIGKGHERDNKGTYPPGPADVSRLESLRKEKVEEESCAKDGGYSNADKYVECCNSNKVVVVDSRRRVQCFDSILLLDVVWYM